jgi:hypothetical protein
LVRVALAVVGVLFVLLLVLQLIVPRIAEHVIRDRAAHYGRVLNVSVSAFPAIQLLWEDAQSGSLRYATASITQQQGLAELVRARGVNDLDVTAASMQIGALQLTGFVLHKRGAAVTLEGAVTEAALRAAVPGGLQLQEITANGQSIEVRAGSEVFGATVSARALVVASQGAIVVEPQGLLGAIAHVTLFADSRLYVQTIALTPLPGRGATWRLSLQGTLAGG